MDLFATAGYIHVLDDDVSHIDTHHMHGVPVLDPAGN